MLRKRTARLGSATAAALLSLSLAAPALADHDDDRRDGQRRGYPVYRHGDACDHDHDWDRDRRRSERSWRGSYGYYDRVNYDRGDRPHERSFGCGPCGKRWKDRDNFHRHLTRHHGVPYRAIPRVVVYSDWGWLFRG